jgi:drug/metabolite transporter (DMT)-like permease
MKFGIDFTQPSTVRGLVWSIAGFIGVILVALGKDPSQIVVLAMGVAGGLGVAVDDNK